MRVAGVPPWSSMQRNWAGFSGSGRGRPDGWKTEARYGIHGEMVVAAAEGLEGSGWTGITGGDGIFG